jgi:hypothetical protein
MHNQHQSLVQRHLPWNKGRLTGQKRPLKPKDVWAIRVRLQLEHRKRDLALFNLAIDSKLRGCDLVRLQVNDIGAGDRVRDRATIIQKKIGRPVQFEITEQTRASIDDWLSSLTAGNRQYLFPSRFREQPHLSTRQMPGSSTPGSRAPGWTAPPTSLTRCGVQRRPRSTRGQGICEWFNCCSATQSSKARCAISASRSMTRSAFPSKSSCELRQKDRSPARRGCDPPGTMDFHTLTIGCYRRRNRHPPSPL